jgi:hypothetical protein
MKSNDFEVESAYNTGGVLRVTGYRLSMENYGVQAQPKS